MAKRIIETNKHIKNEAVRFQAIFRSTYTSFEIENIHIPPRIALKIAQKVRLDYLGNPVEGAVRSKSK